MYLYHIFERKIYTNPTIGNTEGLKSLVIRYSLSSGGINIIINGYSYSNYNIIYLYSVIVLVLLLLIITIIIIAVIIILRFIFFCFWGYVHSVLRHRCAFVIHVIL